MQYVPLRREFDRFFNPQQLLPPGRDPNDTIGTEPPYDEYRKRIGSMFCFFCCFGWLANLTDRLYSTLTHQDRVIGEGRKPQRGIDHLSSLFIISALEGTDSYKPFLTRYYKEYADFLKIENMEIARELKEDLLDLVGADITNRCYRKDQGTNVISWTATLLGACVAIAEFVKQVIGNDSNSVSIIEILGYVEGAFGLTALIITQITNKHIQTHAKATTNLQAFGRWIEEQGPEFFRPTQGHLSSQEDNISVMNSRNSLFESPDSSVSHPIKAKLTRNGYRIHSLSSTSSLEDSLCQSISWLRKREGYQNESKSRVQYYLRDARASAQFQSGEDELMHYMLKLVQVYQHSIFVVYENPQERQSYSSFWPCFSVVGAQTSTESGLTKENQQPFYMLYMDQLERLQPVVPSIKITEERVRLFLLTLDAGCSKSDIPPFEALSEEEQRRYRFEIL